MGGVLIENVDDADIDKEGCVKRQRNMLQIAKQVKATRLD